MLLGRSGWGRGSRRLPRAEGTLRSLGCHNLTWRPELRARSVRLGSLQGLGAGVGGYKELPFLRQPAAHFRGQTGSGLSTLHHSFYNAVQQKQKHGVTAIAKDRMVRNARMVHNPASTHRITEVGLSPESEICSYH